MRSSLWSHFLALTIALLLCSAVSPRGLALHRRALSTKASSYASLSKRADGQSLYNKVKAKYYLPCFQDVSKESNYQQFYKRFEDLPDLKAPPDIRGVVSSLPGVQSSVIFTRRSNTCASLQFGDAQRGECFDNSYSIGSGIIIGEINDRRKDLVPKEEQLNWSDIIFYNYKAMIADENQRRLKSGLPLTTYSVKDIRYIFRHDITNKETKRVIADSYSSLKLDRNTMQTWTYTDEAMRDGFLALLGTPNGLGAAYLVIQHGAEMGFKMIESIITLPNPDPANKKDNLYITLSPPKPDLAAE